MAEGLSIGRVTELTGLSRHTLRYYERAGLVGPVDRAPGGHRRYSAEEVEWIGFLVYLRTTGMPIRGMRRYAELLREGPHTVEERGALLEEHHHGVRDRIEELGRNLAVIEEKIKFCKDWEARHGERTEKA